MPHYANHAPSPRYGAPALQDFGRKEGRGAGHKEAVERVHSFAALDQYVTAGRGGQLRRVAAEGGAPWATAQRRQGTCCPHARR
jgi:hypothetical protein